MLTAALSAGAGSGGKTAAVGWVFHARSGRMADMTRLLFAIVLLIAVLLGVLINKIYLMGGLFSIIAVILTGIATLVTHSSYMKLGD